MAKRFAPLRRYAWFATWIGFLVLAACQAIDAAMRSAPWVIWLVKLGPLLIFLPGMVRDNLRSYIWVSFVSLGYFILAVQRLFAQPQSALAAAAVAAVVVLFVASMLYVRWRAREWRAHSNATQAAATPSGESDE